MASIGDLFLKVIADLKGFHTDVQKGAEKAGDAGGQTLGKRLSASLKKSWSGGEIGKGLVQGLGLAGGLGAATLFTGAISKLGDVLGDAKDAALAEEVSIQKLGTALKANVANWNGNTAAIEKTLQARMKLGFSDDEQRDSLARIVVATKDVNKALAIQRTAMDLARLKGISLADAGEALIKVEGGQFRALKALGIQLPKNATATEALAAVTKAAAGQAEEYAETNAGKLLASQVKVGESMEKLGVIIIPAFVAGTEAAAAISEDLAGNLGGLTTASEALSDALGQLSIGAGDAAKGEFDLVHAGQDLLAVMNPTKVSNTFGVVLDTLDNLGVSTDALRTQFRGLGLDIEDGSDHSADAIEALKGSAVGDLDQTQRALDLTADAAEEMAKDMKMSANIGSDSFEEMVDKIVGATNEAIDDAFDPIITANNLAASNAEASAQRRILASKSASAAEKRDASDTLDSVAKDQAGYLAKLAAAGKTGTKAYKDGMASLKTYIATTSGATNKALQGVYNWILRIEAAGKVVPINIRVNSKGAPLTEHRAAGGPVQANVPYIVGERRAELFVPTVSGRIYPTVQSGLAAVEATAGGTTNIALTMPVVQASDPFETATQLRRLADFKQLSVPR